MREAVGRQFMLAILFFSCMVNCFSIAFQCFGSNL